MGAGQKPYKFKRKKGADLLGKKKISTKKFKFTKTGKLTVAKGKYKKGTYKVTVKISAKGNLKYKPKTVKKTVSIKIK